MYIQPAFSGAGPGEYVQVNLKVSLSRDMQKPYPRRIGPNVKNM